VNVNVILDQLRHIAATKNSGWRTLPPAAYSSEALYELEKSKIFKSGWVCVAREDQVPTAGDYLTVEVAGEPVMLVRDHDGELRALSNVCRHRWMRLCEGSGNTERLVCPYHAWTYRLDGSLQGAPEMSKTPGFDASQIALPRIRHEVWRGFVYVNIDGAAADLKPQLTDLEPMVESYGVDDWRVAHTVDCGEYPWDWKVMQDNGECYHHIGAHAETFERNYPARQIYTECSEAWLTTVSPCRKESLRTGDDGHGYAPGEFEPVDGLAEWQRESFFLIYVLPNFFIYLQPDYGLNMRVFPVSAGRIRMLVDVMLPPKNFEAPNFESGVKNIVDFFKRFNDEDVFVNSRVQTGLCSEFATPAPLSHLEEHNMHVAWWIASRLTTDGESAS